MAVLDATFGYFYICSPKTIFFWLAQYYFSDIWKSLSTCVKMKATEFHSVCVTSILGCFSNMANRSKIIGENLLADQVNVFCNYF